MLDVRHVARSLATWPIVLALGGCESDSISSECDTALPSGFACDALEIQQGQCGSALEPGIVPKASLAPDRTGIVAEDVLFRCEQAVCAYQDAAEPSARLLLQPCDMNPEFIARCNCRYVLSVGFDPGPQIESVTVYFRGDSRSGMSEPVLIGTVDLRP